MQSKLADVFVCFSSHIVFCFMSQVLAQLATEGVLVLISCMHSHTSKSAKTCCAC